MQTIEEVKNYLKKIMKQCDDLSNMYNDLYANAIDKKSKKIYKTLIEKYNDRWLVLSIILQDIEA